MNTIRVLHVYKTYYPESVGGVESVIRQLCNSSKENIVNTVFTLGPTDGSFQIDNHHVIVAKRTIELASTGFSWSAMRLFKQCAREADVIHYHFPWPFMDFLHLTSKINKPTVLTYHSDIVKQKYLLKAYTPLMRRFLSRIDAIVATSPQYLHSSLTLRSYSDKTRVIPLGINPNQSIEASNTALLRHWQTRLPEKFFLFIGVLRYYKGLHFLLDALHTREYPTIIVGSGPEEDNLKKQAKQLGLKNLIFLGKVSEEDKNALLTLCYAFVFPSHLRSEAFGVSLLEAALHGKSMICCEIQTGTSHINQHMQTGLLIQPKSSSALTHAMQYLWDNEDITAQMGLHAKQRYTSMFTADIASQQYSTLYHSLVKDFG